MYEKQESALGCPGAGGRHRAAFGDIAKTQSTSITHFNGEQRYDRLDDDAEHQHIPDCASEQMKEDWT